MKNKILSIFMAAIIVLFLAGCKKDSAESHTGTYESAATETSTAENLALDESIESADETLVESVVVSSESTKSVSSSTSSKPTTTKSTTSSTSIKTQKVSKTITEIEQDIRRIALEQVGKPYVYGGAGPDSYDCSGLIYYILKTAAGVTPPRVHEQQTGGKYVTVLKHRDEVKIGDVIECEKGLALYIGQGEAVYSWGTVQKFEVGMVVVAIRYISGQGTSSENNPHVFDLKYKMADPSQIESVRLNYQIFSDCTNAEIEIMRGYEYNFSAAIEPYTEEFNIFTFSFSEGYEDYFDMKRMTDGGFKIGTTNAGSFTFTATSLNGKMASCTVIIK